MNGCRIARIGTLLFVVAALVGIKEGRCEPRPVRGSQDIRTLFAESQLVVLGKVTDVRLLSGWQKPEEGSSPSVIVHMQTASALVRVENVYKGGSVETIEVQFDNQTAPRSVSLGSNLIEGERVLLFLQAGQKGAYRFADRFWGKFVADEIVAEHAGDGPAALERDLVGALHRSGCGPDPSNAMDIFLGYRSVSPESENQLEECASRGDTQSAAKAIAILMADSPSKFFPICLRFLRANGAKVSGELNFLLSGRIREFGPRADPLVVADLSNLPNLSVQIAALDALAEIKSSATVETVVRHLDDSDPRVQFKAFYALGYIVNKTNERKSEEYSPSESDFDKRPEYYTHLWKRWWAEEGESRYGTGADRQ